MNIEIVICICGLVHAQKLNRLLQHCGLNNAATVLLSGCNNIVQTTSDNNIVPVESGVSVESGTSVGSCASVGSTASVGEVRQFS